MRGIGLQEAAGTPVFFTTPESLTFDDLDAGCVPVPEHCLDVYRRSGQTTTLVSAGTTGADGAQLLAVSRDGARAFFTTHAPLSPADGDAALDLYQASGGAVTLVSAGPGGQPVEQDVVDDVRISANGSHVAFATAERLAAADTDSAVDVYERAGGATTLVSAAPGTGNGPHDACVRFQGCAGLAMSDDGARLVFETADALTPADTDTALDVYERSGGAVRLVSEGGGGNAPAFLEAASANGGRVVFSTAERLVTADTDAAVDVYERAGTTTTLVSRGLQNGNGAAPAAAEGVSVDGSRVVFSTTEALVPGDTDTAADLYARAAGVTELVSGGTANDPAVFLDMSWDGGRVFFRTAERLAAADTDSQVDVYAVGSSSAPASGGGAAGRRAARRRAARGAAARHPAVRHRRSRAGRSPTARRLRSGEHQGRRARLRGIRRAGAREPQRLRRVEGAVQRARQVSRADRARVRVARRASWPPPAKRFAAAAGHTVSVRMKLSRRALRALTSARALKVKVTVRVR